MKLIGHCISEADYFCHKRVRKITKEEEDLVKQLDEASAKPSNIADVLNKKTGREKLMTDIILEI